MPYVVRLGQIWTSLDAYTSEVIETIDDLADAEDRMLAVLGSHRLVRLCAFPEIMGHA